MWKEKILVALPYFFRYNSFQLYFFEQEGAQMGWKTPFLMIKKGNFFDVQAISAPIFRD